MPLLDLNVTSAAELKQHISKHDTIVACLCAAWCDVCNAYRPKLETLVAQHPEIVFLWIDIEDQASLVGDFNIDNFPTILIQRESIVTFYGEMLPDTAALKLVIQSQAKQTAKQLQLQHSPGSQQHLWQTEANLLSRLTIR